MRSAPRSSRQARPARTPAPLKAVSNDRPAGEPTVKSAERTLRILETLAASPTRLSVAELQTLTGYPRSSLHVLIRTLLQMHWIEQDSSGSHYGVGTHALLSGTAYLDRDPALPYAHRVLEALRDEVGQTVHYARLVDNSVLYLASRESLVRIRDVYRVGRMLPAHLTALGQALLAELTPAEVEGILPARLVGPNPASINNHEDLRTALDDVRQRGWSWELEQGTLGVGCVAAAVRYRIPATDAISCSMALDVAQDPEQARRVGEAVVRHADGLATLLRREGIR